VPITVKAMLRPRRPLILLAACLAAAFAAAPARAASPAETVGVFRGAVNTTAVAGWEAWLGRPAHRVLDFLARESWEKIAAPSWWVDGWSRSAYKDRLVYSVPMLPDTPSTLAEGATGAYDVHFERLARLLISRGQGDTTIRLGWEFNGDWYRWNAAVNPTAFVAYWRRIVNAMRRQPGAAFRFDWCPNLGKGRIAPERVYPGDAYVDYIGADVYDHGWWTDYQDPVMRWHELKNQTNGLRWQRDFARAHRKRMSFPEWGLVLRADGHGGGDNPYFVQKMHDWIAANDVAYHNYFEVDMPGAPIRLMTGRFPNAAALFKRLFGPQPPAATVEQLASSPQSAEPAPPAKRKAKAKHNAKAKHKAHAKRGQARAKRGKPTAKRKRAKARRSRAKAKHHRALARMAPGTTRR
jgi:hypothetical protein